jgi:hypothetical protein
VVESRAKMKLVRKGSWWEVEGPEPERARIAFAVVEGDRLDYEVADARDQEGVHP